MSCLLLSVNVSRFSLLFGFFSLFKWFIRIGCDMTETLSFRWSLSDWYGKAVDLSTSKRRSCLGRLGLRPVSNSHTGTIEFCSRFQHSFKRLAICSLVVVYRSQVHDETWTIEPMERYMDSMRLMSNSLRRSSLAWWVIVRLLYGELLLLLLLDDDDEDEDVVDNEEEAAQLALLSSSSS